MPKDLHPVHAISEVQQHANYTNLGGGLLRYITETTIDGLTHVTLCKQDATTKAVVMIGTFNMLPTDWATLKALNPTLNNAPLN